MATIGEKIKEARKNKKMTQKQLAGAINRSTSVIQKYEAGTTEPPLSIVKKISEVLGVSAVSLVDTKDIGKILYMQDPKLEQSEREFNNFIDFLKTIGYYISENKEREKIYIKDIDAKDFKYLTEDEIQQGYMWVDYMVYNFKINNSIYSFDENDFFDFVYYLIDYIKNFIEFSFENLSQKKSSKKNTNNVMNLNELLMQKIKKQRQGD